MHGNESSSANQNGKARMTISAKDEVVFITGASAGIGAGLAREYAKRGACVALGGRNEERLEAVKQEVESLGGKALSIVCEVTSGASLDLAADLIIQEWGRLDTVVANAGFGVSGRLEDLVTDDYRRQFDTNVFGLLDTVYACLPHIIESKGRVVLISSVMGKLGRPTSSAYAASKFAVCGIAESIHYELRNKGVTVTCLNPGLVESHFRMTDNRSEWKEDVSDPAPQWLVVPTGVAARSMVNAIQRRKREVTITGHGKLLVAFHQYVPWLFHLAMRVWNRRLGRA
jgi:short-subunit dehydrogenase